MTGSIGHAGELHPKVVEALGLPPRTCAMELDLDAIPIVDARPAPQVSPYPPVSVDVALVAPAEVPAAELADALLDGGGPLLEDLRLFDVYTGEQVGAGQPVAGLRAALPGPGPHADQRGGQRRPGRRGRGGPAAARRGAARLSEPLTDDEPPPTDLRRPGARAGASPRSDADPSRRRPPPTRVRRGPASCPHPSRIPLCANDFQRSMPDP